MEKTKPGLNSKTSADPYIMTWEEEFDYKATIEWMEHWWWYPFIAVAFYFATISFLKAFMLNKQPFKLRVPLLVWNSSLALFSAIGFWRIMPEFVKTINEGVYHAICKPYISKPSQFWIYLFVLSKTAELIDTVFLCLKKQKLIFLHVYHHSSVLIFTWFIFATTDSPLRWYSFMNYGIHAVMYAYYALKSLPHLVTIPKWVSIAITSVQIFQHAIGFYVASVSSYYNLTGVHCNVTLIISLTGLFLYASFLILFSQFFYKSYIESKKEQPNLNKNAIFGGKKQA